VTESHSWFSQPAHSLFLLGHREEVYDIDYQVLAGERVRGIADE